jgi:hypothetical protein
MIDLVERNDVHPVCPHCEHALAGVWYQALRGFLGKRYIYFCPGCHCVLGISHRKGLWMG